MTASSQYGWLARACRPFFVVFVASLTHFVPVVAAADVSVRLSEVQATLQAGAPGFALDLIDRGQPPVDTYPDSWFRWERTRIGILEREQAWERALARLRDVPPTATSEARRWAREKQAEVHLELGDPAAARAVLRGLILRHGGSGEAGEALQRWRRLVIRSYLLDDAVNDAVTALRRYDRDYPDAGRDWRVLRARVLLQAEHSLEALIGIPASEDPELVALRLLAELRSDQRSSESIIQEAEARAGAEGLNRAQRARYYAVAAEVAYQQEAPGRHAHMVEQALRHAAGLSAGDVLFRLDGDDLWRAWTIWGQSLANRHELLFGDDEAWFAAVGDAWPQYRVSARSMLATVALRGGPDARDEAHQRLINLLEADDGPGLSVIRMLYLNSERFPRLEHVPEPVRFRLVDAALADNDIAFAVELMTDLPVAPADTDPYEWRLLRARVLVLGGEPDAGAEALGEILSDYPDLPAQQLDRLMQVIFDLQAGQAHEQALELFARVGERDLGDRHRRELLYWQAESHESLGDHREAARLFLASATFTDGRGGDPWGQTARYQAAGMLAEIGLVSDARRIYEILLRATDDPSRRAQLRTRLRELGQYEPEQIDLPMIRE